MEGWLRVAFVICDSKFRVKLAEFWSTWKNREIKMSK